MGFFEAVGLLVRLAAAEREAGNVAKADALLAEAHAMIDNAGAPGATVMVICGNKGSDY